MGTKSGQGMRPDVCWSHYIRGSIAYISSSYSHIGDILKHLRCYACNVFDSCTGSSTPAAVVGTMRQQLFISTRHSSGSQGTDHAVLRFPREHCVGSGNYANGGFVSADFDVAAHASVAVC